MLFPAFPLKGSFPASRRDRRCAVLDSVHERPKAGTSLLDRPRIDGARDLFRYDGSVGLIVAKQVFQVKFRISNSVGVGGIDAAQRTPEEISQP